MRKAPYKKLEVDEDYIEMKLFKELERLLRPPPPKGWKKPSSETSKSEEE